LMSERASKQADQRQIRAEQEQQWLVAATTVAVAMGWRGLVCCSATTLWYISIYLDPDGERRVSALGQSGRGVFPSRAVGFGGFCAVHGRPVLGAMRAAPDAVALRLAAMDQHRPAPNSSARDSVHHTLPYPILSVLWQAQHMLRAASS
jgi:hypothetical protein